jgi:hypothetical protein
MARSSRARGTLFRLAQRAGGEWKQRILHEFSNSEGAIPNSTPHPRLDDPDAHGYLYGTTGSPGGPTGIIYRIDVFGRGFGVLYDPDHHIGDFVGSHPQGVVVDSTTTIYGTALDGEAGAQFSASIPTESAKSCMPSTVRTASLHEPHRSSISSAPYGERPRRAAGPRTAQTVRAAA